MSFGSVPNNCFFNTLTNYPNNCRRTKPTAEELLQMFDYKGAYKVMETEENYPNVATS